MSIEWGLPTVWDLLKGAVNLIKRPVKYAMSSKSFAVRLREQVRNLENEARRVHDLAQVADNNLRILNDCFKEWKQGADNALEDARNLLDAFDKASKTCCYGTLPDPYCRYQFSTKAEAEIEVIREVAQKCIRFGSVDDICFINPAPGNVAAPTLVRREGIDAVRSPTATASVFSASTSIKLRDAGVFESRASMIQNIMDALANDSNSVVGVYGMGGVGKSTLLDEVKWILSEEKSFDWVGKAAVSENPDIKTIQGDIAEALSLTDIKNKETISGRAELLHERLKKEETKKKKVLIILDNLWKRLDLNEVGIPCGLDNEVMGCKLLLTSRDRDVLRTEMGCDKDFRLDRLEEEAAKSLFERLVGDKVHDAEFKPWVEEALHKCYGLPFLIVHMAKVLKRADLPEWKNVLKQIKLSKNEKITEVIKERLQLSYNNLKDAHKSLLALCVTYGTSKPSLENLVRYGVGWGLFPEDDKIEEARERLRSGIRTLQDSSLLLEDGDAYGFKIHDLVRDFVASVALSDHPLLVLKDKDKPITGLWKRKLKSCRAVCFPYIDMKELPQELDCPELQIFLLFTNNKSLRVPDSLFHSMRKLMVLNLTGIHLTCSASPFQFLKNLQTLCLDWCSFDDIAILRELESLQILSFAYSKIQRLPKEIGQLVELRLLDLNHCSNLRTIEPGVLGSLINLEELYMEESFDQWDDVDHTPPTNASLIELNSMKNLCTLHVSIPNPSVLPKDINFKQLTKYKIRIGNDVSIPNPSVLPKDLSFKQLIKYRIRIGNVRRWQCKGSSTLELHLDPLSDVLWKGCIQSILGKTDDLFLEGLDGSERSICELYQKGFPELKHLEVKNSPSILYILQSPSCTNFKALESLLLKNLINLEKICHGHITSKSFSTLKVVRVESCDKMEVLFPLSVVSELQELEEIEVVGCKLMRGIVEADDCGKVELCNLRVLELRDLPNIKNFFSAGSASSCSTSIDQVNTQIAFFNGQQVSIPSLESLTIEGLPNLKEIWSDESPLELSNLQSLEVVRCESLLKVISSRSLVKLQKLHTLTIEDCVSVQEVFDLDGPSGGGNLETLFELTTISLYRLPSLRCIWNKNPCGIVTFHDLKELEVDHCDKLGFIFFPSMIRSLTQLRDLRVRDCEKLEAIITEEEGLGMETAGTLAFPMLIDLSFTDLESLACFSRVKCSGEAQSHDRVHSRSTALFNGEVAFPRLENLEISALNNVEFMFSLSVVESLAQLKKLDVWDCTKMEAIIMEEEGLGMETAGTLAFPMLTGLSFINLESLTCFSRIKCSGGAQSHDRVHSRSTALFNEEVAFPRLEILEISGLGNFGFMFFPSMVKSLAQLTDLTVQDCNKMEAIITEEEGLGMETSETLAFPMLTNLHLDQLESLTCFSSGKCSREGQSQDYIISCSIALFNREVVFPGLETLWITGLDNIAMIWDDQVAADSFPKLKSLCVDKCNRLVNVVTSSILGRILSLESLKAQSCGSLKVVFKFQPLNPLDGHPIARSPLKQLELSDLPELKCVWDKELHHQVKFQCLRSVSVDKCESLTSLFPSSIARDLIQFEELKIQSDIVEIIEKDGPEELSINVEAIEGASHELKIIFPFTSYLQHLKTLDVSYYDGLSYMFTPTIATNLVALTKLSIRKCRMFNEVISDEGGREGHVVAFNQLKYMELEGLTRLRCFSSGGYALMFPLLEDVIVTKCLNMNFFSKGPIEAPKLKRVRVSRDARAAWFWKEDLNSTIQNMLKK